MGSGHPASDAQGTSTLVLDPGGPHAPPDRPRCPPASTCFSARPPHPPRRPGWALPVAGGLAFTGLAVLWVTSGLWVFTTLGLKL
jgi:hypothetical protein